MKLTRLIRIGSQAYRMYRSSKGGRGGVSSFGRPAYGRGGGGTSGMVLRLLRRFLK